MREATERLLELGLSEKEAQVYLAMLELGPTGVNDIAKKAEVNRSTTYLHLESLARRGLASHVEREGKTVYTAESPKRLEQLIHDEQAELKTKQKKLGESLPYFMALFNAIEDKPKVRFFEGEEGIVTVRELLKETDGEFLTFTAIDEGTVEMSKIEEEQRKRVTRWKTGRCVMSVKTGCAVPEFDRRNWKVRFISYETSPFTGELNMIGDTVAACVLKSKPMAFVVQSPEMANLFRTLFEYVWSTAGETPVK
jgi:HTH-type transcriptional regulator, sugar sensing transcriptional regulator